MRKIYTSITGLDFSFCILPYSLFSLLLLIIYQNHYYATKVYA